MNIEVFEKESVSPIITHKDVYPNWTKRENKFGNQEDSEVDVYVTVK